MKKRGLVLLGIFLLATGFASAQEDKKGSKDHPLLSRMPGYRIMNYKEQDFEVYNYFMNSKGKKTSVEGRYYSYDYVPKKGVKIFSNAQIIRNYINALTKIGGTVIYQNSSDAYMKLAKDNRITWVHAHSHTRGMSYQLYIIEEAEMKQDIVADAKSMAQDISAQGRVALYGIYFDFDKAEVKPDSDQALKEIATLLSRDPALNLYVVGHTDNVGNLDYNMKLSQARADAVVKTLVSKYNVVGNRLKAFGVGPLSPVTSNDTEEGKAKNRRVELVKQ